MNGAEEILRRFFLTVPSVIFQQTCYTYSMNDSYEKPFYEKGLHFSCKRCSGCCGGSPGFVYLSKTDLILLKDFFHLSIKTFVEKYCRYADYYGGTTVLALQEKKNYDCILWKEGCSAYEARPVQCRTYPFWTWMTDDKESWEECAKDCPGMNTGNLWNKEYIEEERRKYEENKPIYIEEVLKLIEEE